MAFREAGIIVGSLQPVPEPSSLIIALVGLTLVGLSRLHARHPD
ncbi:PEP-CTERM sorting domain-containing protein [Aquabacterium sp. NJ1]|nr:PEP-CTERM sorting domain-containing protein [Aquabacterium sp. NJ1]